MPPILFKACPRCRGDLHREIDIYGSYVCCLQCGYSVDEKKAPEKIKRLLKP